jgi:hypothetical protein
MRRMDLLALSIKLLGLFLLTNRPFALLFG